MRALGTACSFSEIRGDKSLEKLPVKQRQAIEKFVLKEEVLSFMKRFQQTARKDLCEEGGVLYQQWKKWGDLSNEKVLQNFAAILVAMGFSGNAWQVLAVAWAVIVLHLGVKAICGESVT